MCDRLYPLWYSRCCGWSRFQMPSRGKLALLFWLKDIWGILSNVYLLSGSVQSLLWLNFCTAWILKVVLYPLLTCICLSNLSLSKCPCDFGTWGHEDNCSNSNTSRGPAAMTPLLLSIGARISGTIRCAGKVGILMRTYLCLLLGCHSQDHLLQFLKLFRVFCPWEGSMIVHFIHLVFICLTTPWSGYTWVILLFNLYIFSGRHVFVIVHRSVRDISTSPTPRLILRIQGRAVYSKCFENAWVLSALAPTVSSITILSWYFSSWNSTVGKTQGNSRFSSLMVCRPVSCRSNTSLDFFSQFSGFPRSHIPPWIGAELCSTPSKQSERERSWRRKSEVFHIKEQQERHRARDTVSLQLHRTLGGRRELGQAMALWNSRNLTLSLLSRLAWRLPSEWSPFPNLNFQGLISSCNWKSKSLEYSLLQRGPWQLVTFGVHHGVKASSACFGSEASLWSSQLAWGFIVFFPLDFNYGCLKRFMSEGNSPSCYKQNNEKKQCVKIWK